MHILQKPFSYLRKISPLGYILIFSLVILGFFIIWLSIKSINREMKDNLLQRAGIVAQSINRNRLRNLSGSPQDINNPDYIRIKEQLRKIRESQSKCKFLYLMGQKETGEVFFYVDSQSPDSKDYAPPGLIYEEVSEDYLEVFNNLKAKTVGPVEDRWGRLMTGLIPITDSETGKKIAVLGMDVTTDYWKRAILKRTAPLTILIVISVLLVYYIQQLRILKNQEKAEEQIKKREEQYQALFEQAADGILIGNESGIIIDANKSIATITGYDKEELIGTSINILFSDTELKEKPFDYKAVLEGKTVLNERQVLRKDGFLITIEMNTKKVGDGRLQAFFRDITERKKNEKVIQEKNEELREINEMLAKQKEDLRIAKEKAEESDKLKSVFLANMSHEIRTPMNGIIGFSEILTDQTFDFEERKEYLEIIHSLAKNLMQLIDDIIDISKIEANQLNLNKEVFYINDVMDELERIYALRIKKETEKSITLKKSIPLEKEKSKVYTDLIRLKQVLNNLLSNAIKFTEEGTVEFGYELSNQKEWLFWVKDSGIGISEKEQTHIFERFRQAEYNALKNPQGTGLGLTISKNLVELLGGSIWLESKPGRGSVFYFTIPCGKNSHEFDLIQKDKSSKQNGNQWKDKTILIVEDDLPSREYLKKALMSSGAKLILKETGEKGMQEFQNNPNIDLILMDIRLPGIDGTEVIKKIRQMGHNTPIIAQTAHSMNDDRIKYLDAGANDYIAKPISVNALISLIRKYI